MSSVYQLQKLSRTYTGRDGAKFCALDSLDWEIRDGSWVTIQGPSGSGKSTLLSLLGMLDQADAGELRFKESDVARCSGSQLARFRADIGFVFQSFALFPRLDLLDNVSYPLVPRGVPRRRRRAQAAAWLERLGLSAHTAQGPETLSGGEQQRVAVARALACEPEVILADEPTSCLDRSNAQIVWELLLEQHRQGKTIVLASHDEDSQEFSNEVLYLDHGRRVNQGNV